MAALDISDVLTNATEPVAQIGGVPIRRTVGFESYDLAEHGVTDQFLERAGEYYDRYTNPAHFLELYRLAAPVARLDSERRRRVLDIGTGGGNSVFALDSLTPTEAIGVDISEPLLKMCAAAAARFDMNDRLMLLAADLYDLEPVPNSVDLVTGSAILHHMIDPAPIVSLALRALRPGGSAIFMEPFEAGHGILRTACAIMVDMDDGTRAPLSAQARALMSAYVTDYDARCGVGNVREYTQHLDDKWYFTRGWFDEVARRHGCRLQLIPVNSGAEIFTRQFAYLLGMVHNSGIDTLPGWAKRVLSRFDETYSPVQTAETAFTGVVVLTKD